MQEPGRLQSMVLLRVRHNCMTSLSLFTFTHWRRKWQPTPVFLPGESQWRGSLVAAVYGVAQSRTRLKRLSSSSSSQCCGCMCFNCQFFIYSEIIINLSHWKYCCIVVFIIAVILASVYAWNLLGWVDVLRFSWETNGTYGYDLFMGSLHQAVNSLPIDSFTSLRLRTRFHKTVPLSSLHLQTPIRDSGCYLSFWLAKDQRF